MGRDHRRGGESERAQVRQGLVPVGRIGPLAVARPRRGDDQAPLRRGQPPHHRRRDRRHQRRGPHLRGSAGHRDGRGRGGHREDHPPAPHALRDGGHVRGGVRGDDHRSLRAEEVTSKKSTNRPLTVVSLLLSLSMAAMEMTVVSTAMPTVVGDLGGIHYYSWVFTAYLLTSTVTVPIYGKLADLYGRKPVQVCELSIDGHRHRRGEQVRGEDPRVVVDPSEVADHGGHGGGDHRHLHRRHRQAEEQGDDGERPVGALLRSHFFGTYRSVIVPSYAS